MQLGLYHCTPSSFRYSVPINILSLTFNTLSVLSISHAAYPARAQHWNLQDQRIHLRDFMDLNNLSLTPLLVVLSSEILNLTKLWNRFFNYFYCHKWKRAQRSFHSEGVVIIATPNSYAELFVSNRIQSWPYSGYPTGGASIPEVGYAKLLFGIFFAKNCMKIKRNWTERGLASIEPPWIPQCYLCS